MSTESELKSLVEELLGEDMNNHCADEGTTCIFCGRSWGYRHPTRGGDGVIHTPDCWRVRASRILGLEPPLNAAVESTITGLDRKTAHMATWPKEQS